MTRIIVKEIIWNEANAEHIEKHGVSLLEVVEAGKRILFHKRTYGERYLTVSRVGSRLISLVLKRKSMGIYHLVTARDASKEERKVVYEKEKI